MKRDHESTRLLYVAATRARRRLHLLGHVRLNRDGAGVKAPGSRVLLGKIWRAVEPDFEEALEGQRVLPIVEDSIGLAESERNPIAALGGGLGDPFVHRKTSFGNQWIARPVRMRMEFPPNLPLSGSANCSVASGSSCTECCSKCKPRIS